ncbi:MAG: molybdopterin-dependent oxidoreductase [Acidimicrobiales bacterium]|nr:molybdopterin-dependent oxidoreductase [Acidimicrobiales bacterium]
MNSENNTDVKIKSTESGYRKRTEFDEIAWGSHCVDCYPGGCPYHVYIRDGKVIREEVPGPFLDEVDTERKFPDIYPMGCNKGAAWSQQSEAPDRLLHPLRRVGPRGSGEWEEISWDEALEEVAESIVDTVETHGGDAIMKEGTPEVGAGLLAADRFLHLVGGTVTDLNGSINDFAPGHHLTFGKFYPILGDGEIFNSDVIIFWHTNPVYTLISMFHNFPEVRYNGAEIVLFSPDVSPSHLHVDYHVPLKWGTDAALTLAMCQVIVEEDLVDKDFVRTQTDLSLLVREDNKRFLRESDFEATGSDEQFYHLDENSNLVKADRKNLLCNYEPSLTSQIEVTLSDGEKVNVYPLMVRLTEHLEEYRPEKISDITGTNPETLRTIARKVAKGRTRIIMGMGANKAYHSDLYQRAMNLLLGLSGNWGRSGSGINCWAATQVDGQLITGAKAVPGPIGAEEVLDAIDGAHAAIREADPSLSDELATIELWRTFGAGGSNMVPPVFFWYWHCGFKSRWNNPGFNDPSMARSFDEYFDEALASGWWEGLDRPGPDNPPHVLIECGGNMLRRTRGGRNIILDNLWPKLDKVVTIDVRMSATALQSDIVLPAAQHYEKVGLHIPIMALILSDKAIEPTGESLPEWEIFARLCKAVEKVAKKRGLTSFVGQGGMAVDYDSLWNRYTLNGALDTQERVVDEVIRDSAHAGVLPAGTDLTKVREKGFMRFTNWGRMAMAKGQAAPWPKPNETFSAFTNHVELGDPYPTLTRRAQFLIEHPWYVEAGEDLPVHKEPPMMGGNYPFQMTTGHNRWSIHAMNMGNPVLLETHRGEPHAVIHPEDARSLGIVDHQPVRVFNDVGSFVVKTKTSPSQRPGGITVYNGWDPFMFKAWTGPNEVEPGMVKYLGLAGGYGHLRYGPLEWQPVPIDRAIRVGIEPA